MIWIHVYYQSQIFIFTCYFLKKKKNFKSHFATTLFCSVVAIYKIVELLKYSKYISKALLWGFIIIEQRFSSHSLSSNPLIINFFVVVVLKIFSLATKIQTAEIFAHFRFAGVGHWRAASAVSTATAFLWPQTERPHLTLFSALHLRRSSQSTREVGGFGSCRTRSHIHHKQ